MWEAKLVHKRKNVTKPTNNLVEAYKIPTRQCFFTSISFLFSKLGLHSWGSVRISYAANGNKAWCDSMGSSLAKQFLRFRLPQLLCHSIWICWNLFEGNNPNCKRKSMQKKMLTIVLFIITHMQKKNKSSVKWPVISQWLNTSHVMDYYTIVKYNVYHGMRKCYYNDIK